MVASLLGIQVAQKLGYGRRGVLWLGEGVPGGRVSPGGVDEAQAEVVLGGNSIHTLKIITRI